MTEVSVSYSSTVSASTILKACGMSGVSYNDENVQGGRFISAQGNGQIMAAFYHPTKRHTARCYNNGMVKVKSTKSGGIWAVCYAPKSLLGNGASYSVD